LAYRLAIEEPTTTMGREATINTVVEATAIVEVATTTMEEIAIIMADKVTTVEETATTTVETVTTTTTTMEEIIATGEAITVAHLFPNCWTLLRAKAIDYFTMKYAISVQFG